MWVESVVPVDKALEIVLGHTPVLPAEEVELPNALGRVLGEDVHADHDMPPFDRSAMDGYAVRSADVTQAPVVLDVTGQIRAGQWPDRALEPGQAIQIMTGAPVPPGATAVQPVEKTRALDAGRPHRPPGRGGARGRPAAGARAHDRSGHDGGAGLGRQAAAPRGRAPHARDARHGGRAGRGVGHAQPRPDPQQQRVRDGGAGAVGGSGGALARDRAGPGRPHRRGGARRLPRRRAGDLRRRLRGRVRPGRGGAGPVRRGPPLHQGRDQARRAARLRAPR